MGYSNARPDRRPGDKSKHVKLKVDIDDGNNPVPAAGGRTGQRLTPPVTITGRRPKR